MKNRGKIMQKWMMAGIGAAVAVSVSYGDISFFDDFSNDEWKTFVGGSFANPGGWKDLAAASAPLANGWEYVDGWGDAKLYTEYGAANADFRNDGVTSGTGTGQVLGLRKGGLVYQSFSLADVNASGLVTLDVDYWFSDDPLGNVNVGIFDTLPTTSQANDWNSGIEPTETAAGSAYGWGHLNTTVDVSGFSGGTFYVAMQRSGNTWDSAGFDNVSVSSIPEPATLGLFAVFGAAFIGIRRMFSSHS